MWPSRRLGSASRYVVGLVALVGAFLGFAQARIEATARPDAAMLSDKEIATLQSAVRNAKKNPPAPKADRNNVANVYGRDSSRPSRHKKRAR